jgi:paraquat-inducible protein B
MPDEKATTVVESKIVTKKRGRISMVWLVPLFAAAVGLWVAINTIRNEGPKITLVFPTAESLEAGKTKIRYNGIDVGEISALQLSEDHQKVLAIAKMNPKTEPFLVKDTQFWVVRPQISGANISGLGTLISGAFIAVEIGSSKEKERRFVALDNPPMETGGVHGRFFYLKTPELGSLDRGSPIYFRRLAVGQVVSYELDKEARSLNVKIFVRTPYDHYVSPNTRFWEASGIDLSLTATGFHMQTESLLSILVGGIAFETPPTDVALPPAQEEASFVLFRDRTDAYRPPAHDPQLYTLIFKGTVRGLAIGAPVELDGIPIGEVIDINAQFDAKTSEFSAPVTIRVDPVRFGVEVTGLATNELKIARRKAVDALVGRGLRAQLKTGSMLTGAQFVDLDIFPDSPPAAIDWSQNPPQMPTVPGTMESLADNIASIVKKLNQLPLKDIGDSVHKTIGDLDQTVIGVRGSLTNADNLLISANKFVAPDSSLDQQLTLTLQQVGGAAQAMRILADYLERHPESLVRGKTDAK